MANKTRAEYRTNVRNKLEQDFTEKTWTNTYLNECINQIREDFANRFNFVFMEGTATITVVASQQTYSQPSNYHKLLLATINDGSGPRPLSFVFQDDWLALNNTSATPLGRPYAITNFANEFKLYPSPIAAGALKLYFKKLVTQMDDDYEQVADPDIPRRHSMIIEDGVTAMAWESDDELETANAFWRKYEAKIRLAKQEDGEKQMGQALRPSPVRWVNEVDQSRLGTLT